MPETYSDTRKLLDFVKYSRKALEPFRSNRMRALRQYVGSHYSDAGATFDVPVNMIELAVNIYMQNLAARAPQVLVLTNHIGLRASAEDFQYALNEMIRRIRFEESLRLAVFDSLFAMGIVKVGVTDEQRHEQSGFMHDSNEPFVDAVAFDDWVHDPTAKRWDQIHFCGNRYEALLDDLKEDDANDKDAVKEAEKQADNEAKLLDEGIYDSHGLTGERAGYFRPDSYKKRVTLWDLWIPREGKLITYAGLEAHRPLRVVEWEGPENGPYHKLGYNIVPNNIMPLAPVSLWRDLHDLVNRIYNKLGQQAARQKTVLYVGGNAIDDGQRIVRAADGETVLVNNPSNIKEARFGGVDSQNLNFGIHIRDLFSYISGNLDTLGGLGTGAETLGQERLLSASASQRMASMQHQVVSFTKRVLRDVGWWMWHDPLIQIPIIRRIEGADIEVETGWPYQDDGNGGEVDVRLGEYNDYNFDIEPYSMRDQSPGERLQMLRKIWHEDLMPAMQFFQQQGVTLDPKKYLKKIAQYADLPELDEIIVEDLELVPEDRPAVERPRQAPVTTRNYTRTNTSRTGRESRERDLLQRLSQQQTGADQSVLTGS